MSLSEAHVEKVLASARETLAATADKQPVFQRELAALVASLTDTLPTLSRATSQLAAVEAQLEAVRGELTDTRISVENEAAGELLLR